MIERLESAGKGAQNVPLWIRLPLILGALGLAAFWIITNTGVYFWMASLQAGWFDGEHYFVLSGLIAVMVPLVPGAIIVQALVPYYSKQDQQEPMQ